MRGRRVRRLMEEGGLGLLMAVARCIMVDVALRDHTAART